MEAKNFSEALIHGRKAFQRVSTETSWTRVERAANPYIQSLAALSLYEEIDLLFVKLIKLCEKVCPTDTAEEQISIIISDIFLFRFVTGDSTGLKEYIEFYEKLSLSDHDTKTLVLLKSALNHLEGRTERASADAIRVFRENPQSISNDHTQRLLAFNLIEREDLELNERKSINPLCYIEFVEVFSLNKDQASAICKFAIGDSLSEPEKSALRQVLHVFSDSGAIAFNITADGVICAIDAIERLQTDEEFLINLEACYLHQRKKLQRYNMGGLAAQMERSIDELRLERGAAPFTE